MNEADIMKCIKNGYCWLSNGATPRQFHSRNVKQGDTFREAIASDFAHPTRAAAQAAIDERVAKRKADAAHAKMLEDGKHQTTPITPEQAKMLRVVDEFFYLQHGGGAPKYHVTLDKLKRSPDITKWKCFVNGLAYFTHEAALAALDKNKGVASHKTPSSETQSKEVSTGETQPASRPANKYARLIRGIDGSEAQVDVYAVLVAFGVTCPARQHAIKKLLCAGQRGKGNAKQDLEEAGTAINRAVELCEEGK